MPLLWQWGPVGRFLLPAARGPSLSVPLGPGPRFSRRPSKAKYGLPAGHFGVIKDPKGVESFI
eukprot:scaffold55631_cov52-Attheya_sp.AAC.1